MSYFHDLQNHQIREVLLDPDLLAETVIIEDAAGATKTVTVHVDSEVTIDGNESIYGGREEIDRIEVWCSLDTSDDNTRGAITDPAIGTKLHRLPANDKYDGPFAFVGEAPNSTPRHTQYVFERRRQLSQGISEG